MTLVRYVLGYHLVGHVAAAATKIPSCPQVAPPKLLLQMMNMIFRHMPLHDRHFVLTTYLPYQISHSRCHFFRQCWTPILRRPYYVQMNLENRVRAVSIFLHPKTLSYCELNVLKLSPKAEGFDPPKMRQ